MFVLVSSLDCAPKLACLFVHDYDDDDDDYYYYVSIYSNSRT